MRKRSLIHLAIWVAAGIVGIAAVLYARLIAWAQANYFHFFSVHPALLSAATPIFFVVATAIVHRLAPEAKGSGIPQVLEAIDLAHAPGATEDLWIHRLVSARTAAVKVISSTIGIFGGASIGREGPTVQIAASGFAWVGGKAKKYAPNVDFQSFVTAGAAAGVAAAFNTPLAGITFAIEEIAEGMFGPFREIAIVSVIIAGITAQAIAGNYLYFGHPQLAHVNLGCPLLLALPIAVVGGLAGGVFARLLAKPDLFLPKNWIVRALIAGVACAAIGFFTHAETAGSGYEVTRASLESFSNTHPSLLFPFFKFLTTTLSYLSGMAGGIFSPCLSIGSGIGFTVGVLFHVSALKICALIGMVAFFSGVVQAPLTAVVIVMEMTDHHILIIPLLAAALIAEGLGKMLMPVPLYRYIARK